MHKLSALSSKRVIKILEQNGFHLTRSNGSHFIFVNPMTGRRAIVPHHTKDLPKGTLLSILKQAGIAKDEI